MSSPEVLKGGGEFGRESQEAAGEQLKKLHEQLEKKGESSPESNAEKAAEARAEAHKEALMHKEKGSAEKRHGGEPGAGGSTGHATKKQRAVAYQRTMRQIQAEMPPAQRTFSKFIHNPVIEKTSDIVGSTVARPNAIFAGGLCASLLTFAIYGVAKYYGYPLSGFESIGAFLFGWLLGVLYDYFRVLITGRPN